MFTAIVTAMLGVTYLVVDRLARPVARLPRPDLLDRAGRGRASSSASASWSAGTARARRSSPTATGRLDGLVFVLGFAAGTLGFAMMFPSVKGLYAAGRPRHRRRCPRCSASPTASSSSASCSWRSAASRARPGWRRRWPRRPPRWRSRRETMRLLSKLTLNQKLGTLALALGAVAILADVAPGRYRQGERQGAADRRRADGGPRHAAGTRGVDRRGPRRLPPGRCPRREGLRRVPRPGRIERPPRHGARRRALPHRQGRPLRPTAACTPPRPAWC